VPSAFSRFIGGPPKGSNPKGSNTDGPGRTHAGPVVLIAGLGNPGEKYKDSRHNLGFRVVERLAGMISEGATAPKWKGRDEALVVRCFHGGRTVWLAKPQTFMNDSGRSVQRLLAYYKIPLADCLVVVDDLDLTPGKIRQRFGGSDGGHRGLRSIIAMTASGDFMRLRIGIGRPPADGNVISHVLGRDRENDEILNDAVEEAARHCLRFTETGVFENWSSP